MRKTCSGGFVALILAGSLGMAGGAVAQEADDGWQTQPDTGAPTEDDGTGTGAYGGYEDPQGGATETDPGTSEGDAYGGAYGDEDEDEDSEQSW